MCVLWWGAQLVPYGPVAGDTAEAGAGAEREGVQGLNDRVMVFRSVLTNKLLLSIRWCRWFVCDTKAISRDQTHTQLFNPYRM